MNIQVNIKWLLVGALVCVIAGAVGWNYIRSPRTVTKEVKIVKTETKFIHDPDKADFNTLLVWSKSPIKIEYETGKQTRDYTALNVRAFDANKETVEEIRVPVYENADWKIYAGIGAGVALAAVAGGTCLWKRTR